MICAALEMELRRASGERRERGAAASQSQRPERSTDEKNMRVTQHSQICLYLYIFVILLCRVMQCRARRLGRVAFVLFLQPI